METRIENGKHLSLKLSDPSPSVDPSSSVDPLSSAGRAKNLIRLDVTPFLVAKNLLNVSPVDASPNFMPILSGRKPWKVGRWSTLPLSILGALETKVKGLIPGPGKVVFHESGHILETT